MRVGGRRKNLTHADRGEGGVHKNLTFADGGGGGGSKMAKKNADVINEQPLKGVSVNIFVNVCILFNIISFNGKKLQDVHQNCFSFCSLNFSACQCLEIPF